jgi:hypothetical protein
MYQSAVLSLGPDVSLLQNTWRTAIATTNYETSMIFFPFYSSFVLTNTHVNIHEIKSAKESKLPQKLEII